MKKKYVAAILAFPFGIFGIHRFYLGQRFWGTIYLLFFVITMIITIEEKEPIVMLSLLLPFIDAILFYAMPKEDFDDRYNRKRLAKQGTGYTPKRRNNRDYDFERPAHNPRSDFKRMGIESYRNHQYEDAAEYFQSELEQKPQDKATHFNLACTFSILEEFDNSLYHLEKAIEYGFDDFEKVYNHDALSYIRSFKEFDDFVDNDFRRPLSLEKPKEDLLSSIPDEDKLELPKTESDNLLDKIIQLGELRDQGILTEEEFDKQKRKILSGNE